MKKHLDVPLLFRLWHSDIPNRELAKRLNVAVSTLWDIRKKHGLPPRKREQNKKPEIDPTPAEIEASCAAIQAGWSARDRKARLCGGGTVSWRPPSYSNYDRRTSTFSA